MDSCTVLSRSVPLLLLLQHASAETATLPAFQQHASLDFGPKYEVQLMTGAIYPPGAGQEQQRRPASMVMTKKGGKKYRCYLPQPPNVTEPADQGPLLPSQQQVASLLNPLRGSCFYRLEGWWTYELCFMKSMRQFHQEKVQGAAGASTAADQTRITQDYQLGLYWLPEKQHATDATLSADAGAPTEGVPDFRGELGEDIKSKRRYWTQQYGNGTRCDITGSAATYCPPTCTRNLCPLACLLGSSMLMMIM